MKAHLNSVVEVQPYAMVLVVDRATFTLTAVSDNTEHYGWRPPTELIGTNLRDYFCDTTCGWILKRGEGAEPGVVKPKQLPTGLTGKYQLIVHAFAEELVLELEQVSNWPHPDDYAARLHNFTRQLEDAPTINVLMQRLCDGLLHHFDLDRVIVLQFDQQYNGLVTHQARTEEMPDWLGVHFTQEDVPATARYNQLVETTYHFASVTDPLREVVGSYGPASREILRRHLGCRAPNANWIQFLQDSQLSCTGYLSLVVGGALYGSIYYHNREPVYLDYRMRTFLAVVGRVAQQKLAYHIYSRTLRLRQAANVVRDRLQEYIVDSDNLAAGLTGGSTTVVDLIEDTHGVAICSDKELTLFGTTPDQAQVNEVVRWMIGQHGNEELYHTDKLALLYPPARAYAELAAGILFLPLDVDANQWIMWFKPEVVQTVTYGSAAAEEEDLDTQSSRRFYVHDDTRHGYSLPWTADDIGTAEALQVFLQEVVMQRYARAKRNNDLLQQAYEDLEVFSYTVGHDLRAPLRGIASFAEILQEDFGEALGAEGLGHLRHIQQNAERMREFMNDLLVLSRLDRAVVIVNSLSVNELIERVLEDRNTGEERRYRCTVQQDMPPVRGDKNQLITVFTNLLSNAIKYSSQEAAPEITVGHTGEHRDGQPVFFVADNGIGIAADQHDRIFDLFTRSTGVENFTGSGIGLALVRRILNFHEGEIWLESAVGEGTTFYFYTGV